jgi:hypothetical protein
MCRLIIKEIEMQVQQAIGVIEQYAVCNFDGCFMEALFQIGDLVRAGEADQEEEEAYQAFLLPANEFFH